MLRQTPYIQFCYLDIDLELWRAFFEKLLVYFEVTFFQNNTTSANNMHFILDFI